MRLIVFIAFAVSGCAGAIQVGPAAPDNDPVVIGQGIDPKSEIIVYRASEVGLLTGIASAPALLLDGRAVGTCRFGQPLRIRLAAGNYTVSAITQGGEENQWVVVEDGTTTHLRCGVFAAPSLAPKPRLERVDATTASREAGL